MLFNNKYRVESTRLKNWDYSSNGYYYITICTKNKECLFGNIVEGEMKLSKVGESVLQGWNDSFVIREELLCDEYVIMPNHIHGIVIIDKSHIDISVETHGCASLPADAYDTMKTHDLDNKNDIIETHSRASLPYRTPKSISSFIAGFKSAMTKRINEIRKTPGVPVWQDRFYDHIIRDEKSLQKIRTYIVNNPLNWQTDEMNQSA